jgi:hypothetical protein
LKPAVKSLETLTASSASPVISLALASGSVGRAWVGGTNGIG